MSQKLRRGKAALRRFRELAEQGRAWMFGTRRHPLYSMWRGIINRCEKPNTKGYQRYGGRGITICDRWRKSFEAFVLDMPDRPASHTIHRVNNNGHYEPGNCVWLSRKEHSQLTANARWAKRRPLADP